MSFWSKPSTTTALLTVIAILLLIQVVQNSFHPRPSHPHEAMMAPDSSDLPPGHPPMGGPSEGSGMQQNFDPAQMILAALVCPDDSNITLGDPGCSGDKSEERKSFVHETAENSQSIRATFDTIVKKYGESALTERARAIRQSRR